MVSGDMRTSHCFTSGREIRTAFVPEFAACILSSAALASDGMTTLDRPEFSFSLPGVCISGLRVDSLQDGDIRLHFRRYVGDVSRVLAFETSVEVLPATVRERIAVDVLRDIISPIFDMLSLAASSSPDVVDLHSEALQARLNRMQAQQQEIEFYTGMLKRYVSGCQHDVAELSETAEEPATTVAARRAWQ